MNSSVFRLGAAVIPPALFTYQDKQNRTRVGGIFEPFMPDITGFLKLDRYEVLTFGRGVGMEYDDKNWTGPIGALARGEADIVLGVIRATDDRFKRLGFSNIVSPFYFGVLSGPAVYKVREDKFAFVNLVSATGLAILIPLLVAISILYTLLNVEVRISNRTQVQSFQLNILSFYGVLLQHGFVSSPTGPSRRLVTAFWLIMCIVVITAVGANLSSRLAIDDVPERIEKISDLEKYPGIKVYIPELGEMESLLRTSDDPFMKKLWRHIKSHKGNIRTFEIAFSRLMNRIHEGEAVLITNKNYILPGLVSIYCTLYPQQFYISEEDYSPAPYVLPYRKDLPQIMVERINYGIQIMLEADLITKVRKQYIRASVACLDENRWRKVEKVLRLTELKPVFLLFIRMLAVGTTCFLGELTVGYLTFFSKRNTKKPKGMKIRMKRRKKQVFTENSQFAEI